MLNIYRLDLHGKGLSAFPHLQIDEPLKIRLCRFVKQMMAMCTQYIRQNHGRHNCSFGDPGNLQERSDAEVAVITVVVMLVPCLLHRLVVDLKFDAFFGSV